MRKASASPLGDDRRHRAHRHRIEARKRVVEHQQIWIVGQSDGESDPLLVAMGQVLHGGGGAIGQPEPIQPVHGHPQCIVVDQAGHCPK